jgi:GNAT superfamily N-acetyltransferase
MTVGRMSRPSQLVEGLDLESFDCGVDSLNDWLKRRAVKNEQSWASRTYVLCEDRRVIGYYCLATGAVDRDEVPNPLQRNMPDPIPVLVLGRLAVDLRHHKRGLGRALLRDAILRAMEVAEIAGTAALLVHALSEHAREFYLSCGFIPSPLQPMTLCLMLKTVSRIASDPPRN